MSYWIMWSRTFCNPMAVFPPSISMSSFTLHQMSALKNCSCFSNLSKQIESTWSHVPYFLYVRSVVNIILWNQIHMSMKGIKMYQPVSSLTPRKGLAPA
jgi:hypothetical protein